MNRRAFLAGAAAAPLAAKVSAAAPVQPYRDTRVADIMAEIAETMKRRLATPYASANTVTSAGTVYISGPPIRVMLPTPMEFIVIPISVSSRTPGTPEPAPAG